MKAFQNAQEYKATISAFNRKYKKTIKNVYYMFNDAIQLIEKGNLYYDLYEDALIIFRDEGKYWHVSFIVTEDCSTVLRVLEKPCVIGIPDKGVENSERILKLRQAAEKLGFSYKHCNRMYCKDVPECLSRLKDEVKEIEENFSRAGIKLLNYSEEYRADILNMWSKYLVDVNLTREDCENGIKDALIMVDTNTGKVCAVIMPRYCGNDNSAHLVVEMKYSVYKLSVYLNYVLLKKLYERGFQKAYSWIADDNVFSLKLLRKYMHGQDTGVRAYQYIL